MISTDTELSLLESIGEFEASTAPVTQRELATRSGLSLGMTNALLRRLAERGWVKLTKLSPKSIRYALTPEGVGEILRRTAGYFQRAAHNAEQYRARVEAFIVAAKRRGVPTLILAGTSELDFLIEFLCERHALAFAKTTDLERARTIGRNPDVLLLLAESESTATLSGAILLQDILREQVSQLAAI